MNNQAYILCIIKRIFPLSDSLLLVLLKIIKNVDCMCVLYNLALDIKCILIFFQENVIVVPSKGLYA